MLGVFIGSAALRFWGLNRFDTLVFDEVYFAKYGFSYLKQIPFFDVHPPFGKYFLALGIWINIHFFGSQSSFIAATDVAQLDAFAYRWFNAFVGSLIPLLVGAVAYQLTKRTRYALLASLFVAADGLLLVESRYSLINVYLITFGFLGIWCFLKALESPRQQVWLLASGACLGGCASVKWNGLGFLLGIYLLYGLAWLLETLQGWRRSSRALDSIENEIKTAISGKITIDKNKNPLQNLTKIEFLEFGFNFSIVPFLVYRLLWIPHLKLNTNFTFVEMQRQILGYHESIGNTANDHPYCSAWLSWPLMLRPVGYYFEAIDRGRETIVFDVHAFGNPILWWLSTVAVFVLLGQLLKSAIDWFSNRPIYRGFFFVQSLILSQYIANFLPWAKVSRCTYIYHYMAASIFSFMALAWFVEGWLSRRSMPFRLLGIATISIVWVAFSYWMPIYLGLPLSREAFDARMWFRSWY